MHGTMSLKNLQVGTENHLKNRDEETKVHYRRFLLILNTCPTIRV
jgi:hypothetical protein